jgi:hypothetical protein
MTKLLRGLMSLAEKLGAKELIGAVQRALNAVGRMHRSDPPTDELRAALTAVDTAVQKAVAR